MNWNNRMSRPQLRCQRVKKKNGKNIILFACYAFRQTDKSDTHSGASVGPQQNFRWRNLIRGSRGLTEAPLIDFFKPSDRRFKKKLILDLS